MDAIISSALEEICSQGQNGLPLSSLWTRLNTDGFLKESVYSNLLKVPSLQFQSPKNVACDANDAVIQRLEDAEKLGLKIVASSQLRDNFVGLYDSSSNSGLLAPPDILKNTICGQWRLNGYIVSDCDSVGVLYETQHYTRTPEEAAADAIKADLDLHKKMDKRLIERMLMIDDYAPIIK